MMEMEMEMEKHRVTGDRFGELNRNSYSATSSWSPDDPFPRLDTNFANGFPGNAHSHQNGRYDHHSHHNNLNSGEADDSIGGGYGGNSGHGHSFPPSGRKRQFCHSDRVTSTDHVDGGSFVKLYVRGVPRTVTEQDIRSLFGEHGNIVEVVLLKDKKTGLQQECCFVKYEKLEEADRAIGMLNNQCIFSGGMPPIIVRYADKERQRLGAIGTHTSKLYVGCLNKQALPREIEEIFLPYGLVEDVYIVRDELKQSRGCAFVQFPRREMAVAAISALNGTYVMRGCDQPLIVRFADPKKPKTGESRGNSKFGSSSFGSCVQESNIRPTPYANGPVNRHRLPNASHQVFPSTISSAPATPSPEMSDTPDCDWSEHICPDGYKYYFNCATFESRWEKPEEYAFYEEQAQRHRQPHPWSQQHHSPLCPQVPSTEHISQMQQPQLQTQLPHQQLQPPSLTAQGVNHVHVQASTGSVVAATCV